MIKTVIKRDGSKQAFDPDKLNKWAEWSANVGVDWSGIVLEAYRKCYDGCTTKELHQSMISACLDKEDTAHLRMAGRLLIGDIYNEAFGGHDKIPSLFEMYTKMVGLGLWAEMEYSKEDLDHLNVVFKHERDLECEYTSLKQIKDKYAITDRVSNVCYESPQFVYMRMALGNMEKMPKDRRLTDVEKLYEYLSLKMINAPTPFMVNLGTNSKGYASCCVYTTDDSAESLSAGDHIAYMMTCASAGIGSHLKTRSKGDRVRNGTIRHQGKLPYYRLIQSSVHANLQNSRGGAATVHYNALDPEIEDLIVLKNPTTVEQKRIKDIDYSFGYNRLFAEKVAKNGDWMLVSYADNPELYEAMYSGDQDEFVRLYEEHESSPQSVKKFVKARDIATKVLTEAVETGRVYLHRTDEMNRHTSFKDKIYSSNLCQEIGLPTKPFTNIMDLYSEESNGEIGLCSLAAVVAGRVPPELYEDVAYYTVLMIDNVIDLMEYPFPSLKHSAQARRSIGVGITNLAHDMASNGLKYSSQEGKDYIHSLAEMHSYYLHKASIRLARERGICEWADKTKYADGWLPVDTYCKEVDNVTTQQLKMDWESLRKEILELGGIRHSVLEAIMPNESSSIATGTTNSVYPVRSLKVIKTSGTNKNLFLAPDLDTLENKYEFAWDIDTKDMIDVYAIIQKFTGQAISADLYLKYEKEGQRKVSTKKLLTDFLYMTKMGLKTRYYLNSAAGVSKGNAEAVEEQGCASGACTL